MKLFLYDPASVTRDTLTVMNRKGYTCTPLTDDPGTFWEALGDEDYEVLVLLSHGDANGPLAVAGDEGDDVDLEDLAEAVGERPFYLLSCHTGLDPCASTLDDEGVTFVAPLGYAVFTVTGTETVTVQSREDGAYPGWAGDLSPGRASKALSLP